MGDIVNGYTVLLAKMLKAGKAILIQRPGAGLAIRVENSNGMIIDNNWC
jgi:hypothetical protein